MKHKKRLIGTLVVMCIIIVFAVSAMGSDFFKELTADYSNQAYKRFGMEMAKVIEKDNENIIVARINNESINLNEWNYAQAFAMGRAKERAIEAPSLDTVWQNLADRKLKVAAAKQLGIYPNDQEIESYLKEQREIAYDCAQYYYALEGWKISEDIYWELMEKSFIDTLAIEHWNKEVIESQVPVPDDPQAYNEYAEQLLEVSRQEINKLRENATIEITAAGKESGLYSLNLEPIATAD